MLDSLKFVRGAVSKKDMIPFMSHFMIKDGRITAYNGKMALSSPIAINLDCKPKGETLIKVINSCSDTISLNLQDNKKLHVKSGKFKATVDCLIEDSPIIIPEGQSFDVEGEKLLTCFKMISPFIGTDASRPWSNTVLLSGQSAFATNNICLVEHWANMDFPQKICLPSEIVSEIVRINKPPISAQISDSNITFHYENDQWIRGQFYSIEWPHVHELLDKPSNQEPIPEDLFKGLETIKPFIDVINRVYLQPGVISTHQDPTEGTSFDVDTLKHSGLYSLDMLMLLKSCANSVDFSMFPEPCVFHGENLRGIIIGLRDK